jgi:hypothetical protein
MAFCSDSGYRCRLELEGSLLMPPDYNVHITDWERSLRLRCVLRCFFDTICCYIGRLCPAFEKIDKRRLKPCKVHGCG